MSGNIEEQAVEEPQVRVHANPAVAMRWAGNETGHAWQVVERVFEHFGVSDDHARDARLHELFTDMELGRYRPDEARESIALRQGKVAIDKQREHHADQALRQAVAVQYEYQTILAPMTTPGMGGVRQQLANFLSAHAVVPAGGAATSGRAGHSEEP